MWGVLVSVVAVAGWWVRNYQLAINQYVQLLIIILLVVGSFLLRRSVTPRLAQIRPIASTDEIAFPLYSAFRAPDTNDASNEGMPS
jgi:hypothetical protein